MSAPPPSYRVPAGRGEGEVRRKGSRFLAVVEAAPEPAAARQVLEELRRLYRDASHHCWAWRLGSPPRERSCDAGEPAGTAGSPILQVLRGAELTDVVAVVVRWFGGTKLGKGGLARAYAAAAREAVRHLPVERQIATVHLRLQLPYERVGDVKRLVHPPEVVLRHERYGEGAELELTVVQERRHAVLEALAGLGVEVEVVVEG